MMLSRAAPLALTPIPVGGGLPPSTSWLDMPVTAVSLAVLSGLILLIWGLCNLKTQNRRVVLFHLCLCPLPVVVTLLASGPILLGVSSGGTVRASTVVVAFLCGVIGAVSGFVSAILAIVQLRRIDSRE